MNKEIVISDNYLKNLDKYFSLNKGKKVLFIYGENSIKSYDIYSQIKSLTDIHSIEVKEIGGIERNPIFEDYFSDFSIDIVPDIILSVGGGSVVDVAKYIKGEFFNKCELFSILTIVGSDSYKTVYSIFRSKTDSVKVENCKTVPNKIIFSPEITTYVPPNYTAYSSIAIFSKALFTMLNSERINIDDINKLITLIEECLINPFDKKHREQLIKWELKVDSLPLNIFSIIVNVIAHIFNIPYGAALSIITPGYLKIENLFIQLQNNKEFLFYNFKRFADVPDIERLEWWLHSLGSPVKFSEYNINEDSFKIISETTLNICKKLDIRDVSEKYIMNLLQLCL